MSNVQLTIAGRSYSLACAAGEENHIRKLGAVIDARLSSQPNRGAQSEVRSLLFAALLLADELENKEEPAVPSAPPAPAPTAEQSAAPDVAEIAEPLEKIADLLESLASRLEEMKPNP
ncbi:cell division protein ZapA [Altericroceibacterium endophyticum]|uniref:Cell division protein ZapA n=1 Tax=Altericroceibacterium endophyticum TaxID=1808508 RepID=A0A6I4T4S2_9SPHN|nr:cell division protein ZapA [Altericroceibacterium endophyticum]MXO64665.1 cell division protein ZapA [Altericroceibacterium endophyticum]